MAGSSSKIPTPVIVNTDDLTLDEIDRAHRLTVDGSAGNVTALAYVYLKRHHAGVKLADVKQLRQRDVQIVDDSETESDLPDVLDPTQ